MNFIVVISHFNNSFEMNSKMEMFILVRTFRQKYCLDRVLKYGYLEI